ncbi:MAG: hypothetical protein AB1894_29420 [Chloroflexota bacterium]
MHAIPPVITPLLTAVINDATMPAALLRSYARLFAAAWRQQYRRTEPLDFETQLVPLLGVRRSQARQQLRALRFAKLLDWSSDGSNHYVISFHPPPEVTALADQVGAHLAGQGDEFSGKTDSVNGVVDSESLTCEEIQQQLTEASKADAKPDEPPAGLPGQSDPAHQQVSAYLLRAGVWADVAERIARQIVANRRRIALGGQQYLPDVEDVLGWIAYCFADRQKNNITQPAAVLAANLNANRRCPPEYRPPRICAACGYQEDDCGCDDDRFRPHFPPEFLERAFRSTYSAYLSNRWGVCERCGGFPCKC